MKSMMFLILLVPSFAFAVCSETDGGKVVDKKGITKWTMQSSCAKPGNDCRTVASYEKDYCLNNKTLVEFFCEADVVKQENISCDKGCAKARCL